MSGAPAPAEARAVAEGLFRVPADGGPPALVGGRCRHCGATTFMLKPLCPGCWAEGTQDEVALSRRGQLYSFTVIHRAPKGFQAPYAMGYVDLPEGLRVLAHVVAEPPAALEAGAEVELGVGLIGTGADGRPLLGPIFRVVTRGGSR